MTRIKTDFDEVVVVAADPEGVALSLVHGIQELGEIVLRPTQAERLAAELACAIVLAASFARNVLTCYGRCRA